MILSYRCNNIIIVTLCAEAAGRGGETERLYNYLIQVDSKINNNTYLKIEISTKKYRRPKKAITITWFV